MKKILLTLVTTSIFVCLILLTQNNIFAKNKCQFGPPEKPALILDKKIHANDIEVSTQYSMLVEKVTNKRGISLTVARGGCNVLKTSYLFEGIEDLPKIEREKWSGFGDLELQQAKWSMLQDLIVEFKLSDDFVIKALKEFNEIPPKKRKLNVMHQFQCGTEKDKCYIFTNKASFFSKTSLGLQHEFSPKY